MSQSDHFGTEPLGKLLRQQAIPASIGILILSIYGIVDTIFVGRWVGPLGIGAITVVLPINFLISSIGMAIGVGGASIISRALGANNPKRAFQAFGNQILLTLSLSILIVLIGSFFIDNILNLFGGKGNVLEPAREYFSILLYSIPFLAWAMMSNNVIRAIGFPRMASFVLIVPAIANVFLDPLFIVYYDMGIAGAAWATALSYVASALYATWFFIFKNTELKITTANLIPNFNIIKEIFSIGSVTLARQGSISLLAIVLNNSLYAYGGDMGLSVYGIINRCMMFVNFPIFGIAQGFVPIVGYNYGAKLWERVREVIGISIRSGTFIALGIFALLMIFTPQIIQIFTTDEGLISQATPAMRWVFAGTPLMALIVMGSAYFQAVGKVFPALMLALTKQGFCLIPLVLLLPLYFGINGIWYAFPLADLLSAGITYTVLQNAISKFKAAVNA